MYDNKYSVDTDISSPIVLYTGADIVFKVTKCSGNWEIIPDTRNADNDYIYFSKTSGVLGDTVTVTAKQYYFSNRAVFYLKDSNEKIPFIIVPTTSSVWHAGLYAWYLSNNVNLNGNSVGTNSHVYISEPEKFFIIGNFSNVISSEGVTINKVHSYFNSRNEPCSIAECTLPDEPGRYSFNCIKENSNRTVVSSITVYQVNYFTLSPKIINVPTQGGEYIVTVNTNVQYTYNEPTLIQHNGNKWVTFVLAEKNNTTTTYKLKISPEYFVTENKELITFKPLGLSSETLTITQDIPTPYIKVNPKSASIGKEVDTWLVNVVTNIPKLSTYSTLQEIEYKEVAIDHNIDNINSVYRFNAPRNTSSIDRSGYVEWSGSDVSARHTVLQSSEFLFNVIDSETKKETLEYEISNSSGFLVFDVITNTGLQSIKFSEDWAVLDKGFEVIASGPYTEKSYRINFKENNDTESREVTITFNNTKGQSKIIVVKQEAGIIPSIEVTPEVIELDSEEHDIELTVTATLPWSIYSVSRFITPDWITLKSISGEAGEHKIQIHIKPSLLKDRSIVLNFRLNDYPEITDSVQIIQHGIENGYDITDIESVSDWSDRMETKIRDKYLKVKVRYPGNDLAVITAIRTLYDTSFN